MVRYTNKYKYQYNISTPHKKCTGVHIPVESLGAASDND